MLHSGKFSERTMRNLGKFSACSPALFDISDRKFTAPLYLTPSYPRAYNDHAILIDTPIEMQGYDYLDKTKM